MIFGVEQIRQTTVNWFFYIFYSSRASKSVHCLVRSQLEVIPICRNTIEFSKTKLFQTFLTLKWFPEKSLVR